MKRIKGGAGKESIEQRWKDYFHQLLNAENPKEWEDGVPNKAVPGTVQRREVVVALAKMRTDKATELDEIPAEEWRGKRYSVDIDEIVCAGTDTYAAESVCIDTNF